MGKRGDFIPGIHVDGMDILAVREATRFATEYCQENGPLVYEISTYRYHGHSMSDPGTRYRIVGAGLAEVSELKAIEAQVRKDVDADVKKVKSDTELPVEELCYDVYEENQAGDIRG